MAMPNYVKEYIAKALVKSAVTTAGVVFPLTTIACETSYDFTSWMGVVSFAGLCIMPGIIAFFLGKLKPATLLVLAWMITLDTCANILIDTQTHFSGKPYPMGTYMYIWGVFKMFSHIVMLFLSVLMIYVYPQYKREYRP